MATDFPFSLSCLYVKVVQAEFYRLLAERECGIVGNGCSSVRMRVLNSCDGIGESLCAGTGIGDLGFGMGVGGCWDLGGLNTGGKKISEPSVVWGHVIFVIIGVIYDFGILILGAHSVI